MQTASIGDNLNEASKPIFWEQYFTLSLAEIFIPACLALRILET